jgi:ribosomal protein S18 acetylase RimI-like enzyme
VRARIPDVPSGTDGHLHSKCATHEAHHNTESRTVESCFRPAERRAAEHVGHLCGSRGDFLAQRAEPRAAAEPASGTLAPMHGDDPAPLILVAATERDVDTVFALYRSCTAALLGRGIRQWDDHYPNRATASDAVARGDLFLIAGGDRRTVGAVILNNVPAPEYADIAWRAPEPALVIHALVIDPHRQGAGLGRATMSCCEAFARTNGFASIRLDAYPGNPGAIALYERLGYERRGDVSFGYKPPGHQRYVVYEKPV